MNRFALLACAVIGFSAWAPAQAEPLSFGAINGSGDFSKNTQVAYCPPAPARKNDTRTCALTRTSFGGLPVREARMSLNAAGRVQSLHILLDGNDFNRAFELLAGRYGPPTALNGFALWIGFDDGGRLAIRKARAGALISFDFPANKATPLRSAPDPRLAWSLLAFAIAGVGAGLILHRARRTRRTKPVLSMRDTLERKVREGVDLQF